MGKGESILWILVVSLCCTLCTCYKHFQLEIPNGEMVPHPCKADFIWRGVGHENHLGGGPRNVFGTDFDNSNYKWTAELCRKDSDGDGKTNGAELGDPDCTWAPGMAPKFTTGLSHPGICDPFDSSRCNGKADFVQCENLEFECAAVDETETQNFTVRFPQQTVPAQETTHICMTFEFPSDQEYHMVANVPIIDNVDVMHHMLLYGCEEGVTAPLNTPTLCGMGLDPKCQDVIGLWAIGANGQCFHSNSGFLVGGTKGYKLGTIQFHWNNPQLRDDFKDMSGLTMFLTPKLRPHNAGILMIGQAFLEIPPGKDSYVQAGTCPEECSRKVMKGSISVTSAFNHMHYLGAAQMTELRRNDKFVRYLALDKAYSYDTPVEYTYADAITVMPGDELKTTCVFRSTAKTTTTNFGDATSDEMCISFLTYFPKENLNEGACLAWGSISACDRDDGMVQGCNTTEYYDPSNEKMVKIYGKLLEVCQPLICRQECLNYVREVKKLPCFHGDIHKQTRFYISQSNDAGALYMFAHLDSCDRELALENNDMETNSAHNVIAGCLVLLLSVFANCML